MTLTTGTILGFGLCCAVSMGHVFTGVLGFALGRQRTELNALFAGLTVCAAWTVFWLGAYPVWPLEQIIRFRLASQLLSGFIGPQLLLFCWGLVHPDRVLPRWSWALLGLGLFGTASAVFGAVAPDRLLVSMRAIEAGEAIWDPVLSPLYVIHTVESLGTATAALGVLGWAIATDPRPEVRAQAGWMILAAATALAGFVFGNVLYLVFRVRAPFLSPLASVPALALAYRALMSNREVVARLRTERKNLSRYVPAVVAARAEAEARLGGEEARVAVLFTDLRGFTSLSEDLEPAEVIRILNVYLGEMTAVVQAHGGFVDKYIGDAVLAVFGLDGSEEEACRSALEAGLEMQRALERLNAAGRTPGLAMGVGIHFGPVVHGNVGSEARMEYTVLGDTVNLASRVEAMCAQLDVAVVVTEAVAARLDRELVDLGEQPVRGRRRAVRVFGVTGPAQRQARSAMPKR